MVGLCPGFKHVDAFGEDEEYEEEVEVSYVTLDLGTNVDKGLLPNTSEYRLIGLDTATPMLQLSGLFFKGSHEQLIGTEILFTDGRDDKNLSRKFVVPVDISEQRIQFEQVEVVAKASVEETGGDQERETHTPHTSTGGRGNVGGKGKGRDKPSVASTYGETVLDLNLPPQSPIGDE